MGSPESVVVAAELKPLNKERLFGARGELRPEAEGEVRDCEFGSMSSWVRKELSERPDAVEVRARKRSRRLF